MAALALAPLACEALVEPAGALPATGSAPGKRKRRIDGASSASTPSASASEQRVSTSSDAPSSSASASSSAASSSSSTDVPAPGISTGAPSRLESLGGALTRALIGTLAFVFRAPVRLFRPVKLSSWTLLEAMAKREGRTLSVRYLRMLVRREQASFLPHLLLPPLLANTAVGFTLFEAYTLTESRLLSTRFPSAPPPDFTPLSIVALSGLVAGAAQCLVSAPLDNVRLVLASRRHVAHKGGAIGKALSWRAVLQAALLPFAPSNTRQKLVQAVQAASPSLSSSSAAVGSASSKSLSAQERRKALAAQLARLRSGVHGAGLLMSLARDSIGFAAFFTVFEVSRRVAFHASRAVDRGIARLNASPTLPVRLPYDDAPHRARGEGEVSTQSTSDLARSRTRSARFVAALVLVVGGAVGAAIYELVGRPAELMRAVIWQGRKAAERGEAPRARSKARKGARMRKGEEHGKWEGYRAGNRVGERGTRVHGLLAHARASTPPHHPRPAAEGAAASIASTSTTHNTHHASAHAKQRKPLGPIAAHRRKRLGHPVTPSGASETPGSSASVPRERPRPSAWSLLVQHARRTSRLDGVGKPAGTAKQRGSTAAGQSKVPLWRIMGHTYFIAPYTPAPRPAPPSSSPSASRPLLLRLLPPRLQQSAPSSLRSLSAARAWGSGRAAWALKRLASPYGLGFLAYAWLAGDLAP